ncbi:M1 family metallopeptidase [Nocardioidaceae bacterium]|nr:M1 family metallopeptidase [Nocardioidaceae bacterium]
MGRGRPATLLAAVLLVGVAGSCTGTDPSPGPAAGPASGPASGPAPSGGPAPLYPGLGNPGYDVLDQAVDVTWVPQTRGIDATARITLRTTEVRRTVRFDYRGPYVLAVRVDGAMTSFDRTATKLHVGLGRRAGAGEEVVVEVRYRGRPAQLTSPAERAPGWFPTDDGLLAYGEPSAPAAWTPANEAVTDKATWTVRLTTPEGLLGVAGGTLADRVDADGTTTTTWRLAQPAAPYQPYLAIGEFEEVVERVGGIELRSYLEPGVDDAVTSEALAVQSEGLRWMVERFGPYPFDVGGFTLDDSGGEIALENQTRPVYDGLVTETLVIHELAHQWFGNAVTVSSWPDIWLNEGFATYVEWRWRARNAPERASIAAQLTGALDFYPDEFWDLPPHPIRRTSQVFAPQVYVRGAMTLAALELRIGTDTVDELLRTWVERHLYGNASSAQFERLAAQVAGEDLDAFFEEWLRTPGRPDAPQD